MTFICSWHRCLVVMLTRGNQNRYGTFSVAAVPVDIFYREVSFLTPPTGTQYFVSIVADSLTEPSVDDILLNGESLGASWKSYSHPRFNLWHTWMALPEEEADMYILKSDTLDFASWTYHHVGQRAGGGGFLNNGVRKCAIMQCSLYHYI